MNILSNLKTLKYDIVNLKEGQYDIVKLNGQDNKSISYKLTNESDNNILNDLLECSAFATALLYLNENYILEIGKFKDIFEESGITVENYYSECNDLLNKNIEIVEEAGIPLIEIHGYKIFEGAGYILRGNGKKKIKESFNDEDLDTMESKDNDLPINESEKFTKSQVRLKTQKLKYLCMNIQKNIAQYEFGRRARVGYNYDENGDISGNRIRIETDYIQELDPAYVTQSISDIVKSYIPEAKLDDIQIKTHNYTKYNYKTHKDTIKTKGIRTCYYIVPGIMNEEGTQASDIAPKVDQDMNKNITTSKKKHYDILLSGLDEGLDILNKGFLKNSKGQYQRGNYILVKEGDKYLAIHKDKLKESNDYYIKNNPELKQVMDDLYIKLENELNSKLGITLEGEPFGTYIQEWKTAKIPINDNNTIKVDLTYTLPDGIYNSIYIMYTARIITNEGPGEVMNSGIYASSRTSTKDLISGSYSAWNDEKPDDIKQKNATIDSFINTINNTIKKYR